MSLNCCPAENTANASSNFRNMWELNFFLISPSPHSVMQLPWVYHRTAVLAIINRVRHLSAECMRVGGGGGGGRFVRHRKWGSTVQN